MLNHTHRMRNTPHLTTIHPICWSYTGTYSAMTVSLPSHKSLRLLSGADRCWCNTVKEEEEEEEEVVVEEEEEEEEVVEEEVVEEE